jgi:hypothetical protein
MAVLNCRGESAGGMFRPQQTKIKPYPSKDRDGGPRVFASSGEAIIDSPKDPKTAGLPTHQQKGEI